MPANFKDFMCKLLQSRAPVLWGVPERTIGLVQGLRAGKPDILQQMRVQIAQGLAAAVQMQGCGKARPNVAG